LPLQIEKIENNVNNPEQKVVKISYKEKNNDKYASLLYPSAVLKRCGEMMKNRKDC